MNKKNTIIVIFVIAVFAIAIAWAVSSFVSNGYLYVGDGWQDTPEKALAVRATAPSSPRDTLTVATLILTINIEDFTEMTFVSKADTLVTVSFVKNDKGQYHVSGYSEEISLDDPTSILLNGDINQDMLFPYAQRNHTIWGWCYTDVPAFTIAGITPERETYTFECQGKTRSIDFFIVKNVMEEYPDIVYPD